MQNLRKYIEWTKQINDYETAPEVADPKAWGFEELGQIKLPKDINLENAIPGDEGYSSIRNDKLIEWAESTWPDLKCVDAKIQIQKPKEECKPHLDFLGDYLERVCESMPIMYGVLHSLDKPGLDVWRMFVAIEDNVPGQIFSINNKQWQWKRGDCIRLNNWQALHWTKNESTVERAIIKITGIL
tara:strand:+ start:80 stop:634 length:555 start_codon:yes stop_codon:yes gene_type:complete